MSLTSYRAAPPRVNRLILSRDSCSKRPFIREVRAARYFAIMSSEAVSTVMHAPIEPEMGEKPALQPDAAIGPAMRAIAGHILAKARTAILDPERTNEAAVHDFRRAMKQWRALMRLLAPFIPDADALAP